MFTSSHLRRRSVRRLCLALAFVAIGSWLMLSNHSAGQAANSKALVAAPPVAYVRVLQLATKDIVYDPFSHFIYASVPSSAGRDGNSITPIDPATATMGAPVFIGSEPGKLAISDNGQYLYAALDGAASVRRFDLATRTAALQFSLSGNFGTGGDGPFFVEDMAVMPGNPSTVAVSRQNIGYSPRHEGVAIYDDGVQRSAATTKSNISNAIEFSSSGGTIYGYESETSGFNLRKLGVSTSGVTLNSSSPNLISGYNVDIKYDNGLVYSTTGRAVNPETQTVLGTFSGPSFGSLVAPDSATGRVFFLTGSGSTLTLRAFNPNTFLEVGAVTIGGVVGTPTSLIRWGTNGLAFRTDSNQLFLIQTDLVPSGDTVPAPTPTPSATPTPTPLPVADDVRQVALQTKDLIYDSRTQTIYASVPASAGANGNSITPIDPATATMGAPVFIGSEPGKLAISDNGQYLYAALDGAASVRRFDLATHTAALQFSLGTSQSYGPLYAEDIEVLPGSPGTVAVSRRNIVSSARHEGVAIYDDGVQRPTTTPRFDGSNVIEFSKSAGTLYGYNTESTEYGFRQMSVNSAGVTVTSITQRLLTGFNLNIKFDNGLIYANTGRVINPQTGALVGMFTGLPSSPATLVAPDSATGRVYFLYAGSDASTLTLRAYDMRTYLPIGAVSITGASGTPTSLIRWGAVGLAFRTDAGKVFLLRTHLVPAANLPSDFDGDGRLDMAVWRGAAGDWYVRQSGDNAARVPYNWGSSSLGDVAVPGDYDGDRKTDIAVWRASEGNWYIVQSSTGTARVQGWGESTDVPVPADYDGDRKADIAVWRPSDGNWYVLQSLTGTVKRYNWGMAGDVPVPGDYDRDGLTDATVFRPSEGNWYILQSASATVRLVGWGESGDRPVPADYDGDGHTDVAVFRVAEGNWYILQSATGNGRVKSWGGGDDVPVPGDYDGDGRADIAVWRSGESNWYVLRSATDRMSVQQFGLSGDLCVAAAYHP